MPRDRRAALCHWMLLFFFSSRRRHTRCSRDWSSDVCSSDLKFKFNWSRYGSPELDRILRQADALIDVKQRQQVLAQIQKYVLDHALMFPVHVKIGRASCRERV